MNDDQTSRPQYEADERSTAGDNGADVNPQDQTATTLQDQDAAPGIANGQAANGTGAGYTPGDEDMTMAQPVAEPQLDAEPQLQAEPAAEPAAEPVAERVAEPVAERVAEPVAEPAVEQAPEPVAEPAAEPAGEVAAQPDSDELVVRSARDSRLGGVAPNASMEDLLRASEQQYRTLKHGDVVEGTVMRVDREEILVDIGAKTEGVIPAREAQSLSDQERERLQIGDPLLVSVVQPENSEGHAVLSLDRARQEKAWRDLQHKFEAGEVVTAQVVGHNKGGLLVNIEGIRGFIPSSQVASIAPGEANKQAEMSRLHGHDLSMKIIEINRHRNRLILSERQAVQEQRESMRARLLQELEPGQVRPGTVTSVCDFGAFVDIGGADGLIHLSELSWKRVSHPSEVLKVGDRINVYVLSVDPKERKIALSLKRTQPEPWETITEQYTLGQVVRGTITQITSFGAFARLEDGIEGLIHVSELAEGRVAHPKQVVDVGQSLDLKVIRIDPARKRIGLSLKRMQEEQPQAAQPALSEAGTYAETGAEQGAPGEEGAPAAHAAPAPQPRPEQHRAEHPQFLRQPQQAHAPQGQRQGGGQQQPRHEGQPRPERDRDRDRDRGREGREGRPSADARYDEEEPLGALGQALMASLGRQAVEEPRETRPQGGRQGREQLPAETEKDTVSGSETAADADATSVMPPAAEVPVGAIESGAVAADEVAQGGVEAVTEGDGAGKATEAEVATGAAPAIEAVPAVETPVETPAETTEETGATEVAPASERILDEVGGAPAGAAGESESGAVSGSEGVSSAAEVSEEPAEARAEAVESSEGIEPSTGLTEELQDADLRTGLVKGGEEGASDVAGPGQYGGATGGVDETEPGTETEPESR